MIFYRIQTFKKPFKKLSFLQFEIIALRHPYIPRCNNLTLLNVFQSYVFALLGFKRTYPISSHFP